MLEYWQRNRGRMTKRVRIPAPAPPATTSRPATGPTSAAATQATQPAEPKFRDVVIQRYSEAKPDIREVLKGKAAEDKMSALLRQAEELIDQYGADEGAYSKAAAAMIRPADALLGKMIARIPFRKAPLASIIEHLQDVTGVKIVYPFGRHGTWFLDETVAVEIDPKWGELSLGELLAKLSAAHGYPKFQWVTCAGFESVIFPSAPVDLVPLSSGRTGMVGPEEIVEHELLGAAVLTKEPTGSAQTLASIASTAEELQGPELRRTPLVKVGGDFRPAMYVSGDRPGRLLWRLVKAEAAHTPQQLTPEIRRQVVADLKTVEALKKAEAAAEAKKTKLDAGGRVAELSKQQDREVVDTELLARNTDYFGQIAYTSFPGVGASREFIEKAFELVPDDPEPPHAGTPAAVIPLRRKHEVVLAQRVGYEPAVESEFREGALALVRTLLIQRRRTTLFSWFSGPAVARRVGFVERLPEK